MFLWKGKNLEEEGTFFSRNKSWPRVYVRPNKIFSFLARNLNRIKSKAVGIFSSFSFYAHKVGIFPNVLLLAGSQSVSWEEWEKMKKKPGWDEIWEAAGLVLHLGYSRSYPATCLLMISLFLYLIRSKKKRRIREKREEFDAGRFCLLRVCKVPFRSDIELGHLRGRSESK